MILVPFEQQEERASLFSSLHTLLPLSSIILDTEKMQQEPEFSGLSQEELVEKQAMAIGVRIKHMGDQIDLYALEMGWLLSEGQKLGVHRFFGRPNMVEWMNEDLRIPRDTIMLAYNKYRAWELMESMPLDARMIVNADPIQVKLISEILRNSREKVNAIAQSLSDVNLRQLPDHEREAIYEQANEQYRQEVAPTIVEILECRPADLKKDLNENGIIERPCIVVDAAHVQNRNTREQLEIIASTGRFTLLFEDPQQPGHLIDAKTLATRLLEQQAKTF